MTTVKREWPLIVCLFLSGASALIYEITWIKPISFIFKSTTYVLSIILASFMLGLAIGSFVSSFYVDKSKRPLVVYAYLEIAIGIFCFSLLGFFNVLPYIFQKMRVVHNPAIYMTLQFFSVFVITSIPTIMMGATLPFVVVKYRASSLSERVGDLYAANNAGAILGSLAAGFLLIPHIGLRGATVCAVTLNAISAFIVLFVYHRQIISRVLWTIVGTVLFLNFIGVPIIERDNNLLGVFREKILGYGKRLFYEEGLYGSIAVMASGKYGEKKRILLNGQGSSSLRLNDVRTTTLLGVLPVIVKPDAKTAFIIGFGTGGTSNVVRKYCMTVTAEIEPKMVKISRFFKMLNDGVLSSPNHTMVYDDGRNYLLSRPDKYDIIINHPLDPYQSFSSLLFTKEFFQLAESRLTHGGVYVQWVPAYNLTSKDFKDFYATFKSVFLYHHIFVNFRRGESFINVIVDENGKIYKEHLNLPIDGNELIMVGSKVPLECSMKTLGSSFSNLNEDDIRLLGYQGLDSPESIFRLYLGDDKDLEGYETGGQIITDDHPTLEYSTPLNKIRMETSTGNDTISRFVLDFINKKNSKT